MLKRFQDKGWSLVDAASFVVMRRHGMTEALTTDHHFDQGGFTRLPTPWPAAAPFRYTPANEPSVMPPSTTSTVPVTKLEAGEAR